MSTGKLQSPKSQPHYKETQDNHTSKDIDASKDNKTSKSASSRETATARSNLKCLENVRSGMASGMKALGKSMGIEKLPSKKDIVRLEGTIGVQKTEIGSLKADVENLEGDLKHQKKETVALQNKIVKLDSIVDTIQRGVGDQVVRTRPEVYEQVRILLDAGPDIFMPKFAKVLVDELEKSSVLISSLQRSLSEGSRGGTEDGGAIRSDSRRGSVYDNRLLNGGQSSAGVQQRNLTHHRSQEWEEGGSHGNERDQPPEPLSKTAPLERQNAQRKPERDVQDGKNRSLQERLNQLQQKKNDAERHLESAQSAITQHEDTQRTHQGLFKSLEVQMTNLRNENSGLEASIVDLKQTHADVLADKAAELTNVLWQHESTRMMHQDLVESLRSEITEYRKDELNFNHTISELNRSHNDATTEAGHAHATKMQLAGRTSREHEARAKTALLHVQSLEAEMVELREAMSSLEATNNDMNRLHQAEIAKLKKEHGVDMDNLKRLHETIKSQLGEKYSQLEGSYTSDLEAITDSCEEKLQQHVKKHEAKEKTMKADYEEEVARLKANHVSGKAKLKKDVEAYSVALLARDEFRPMSDSEIKSGFTSVFQDVDTLARLDWKPNHRVWTDQVLRSLAQNQRVLKKQILLDSIWYILYRYIFSSPFRILGKSGKDLDRKWRKECGHATESEATVEDEELTSEDDDDEDEDEEQDSAWPPPNVETERWRWVAIKECQAALRRPAPSEWDRRAELKRGFTDALKKLIKDLNMMLEDIVDVDKATSQAIDKLAKKAASMWLMFGTQRCRIRLTFHGSNLTTAEQKVRKARKDTLVLVAVPGLIRFGNAKGLDLNVQETVGGSEEDIVRVSFRSGRESPVKTAVIK